MRKDYQPGALQEAIPRIAVVAVAFNADGIPTLLEVEKHNRQGFYENSLYDLVQTRRAPRQWFLDGPYAARWPHERKFHDPERKLTVDFSWCTFSGTRAPLRRLWVAPPLRIVASNPEGLAGVELLADLPPVYALDGHLQRILEHAYEDFFIWCRQCEDWESDSSRVHNRHVAMAMEANEERAFFCEHCRLYQTACLHYASNEVFWAAMHSTR